MAAKKNQRTYKFSKLNNVAHRAMDWIGSVQSLAAHTVVFIVSFSLIFFGIDADRVLLVLTTLLSLEAIYLAIFIQMAVNQNSQSLYEVEEDIDEIQEDVEEIQSDVDKIEKDIDDIEKDVDEIQSDVDKIEKDEDKDVLHAAHNRELLSKMEERLHQLTTQIEKVKGNLQ